MGDEDSGTNDECLNNGNNSRHVTYDEYSFTVTPDSELQELIERYEHIFSDADPMPDVRDTWTLEKPVGLIEILPPGQKQRESIGIPQGFDESDYPQPEEIGAFLYEFEQWFYYEFDGYQLFFSRFPHLPSVATRGGTALRGVLFGYNLPDVAQFVLESDRGFKTDKEWEI